MIALEPIPRPGPTPKRGGGPVSYAIEWVFGAAVLGAVAALDTQLRPDRIVRRRARRAGGLRGARRRHPFTAVPPQPLHRPPATGATRSRSTGRSARSTGRSANPSRFPPVPSDHANQGGRVLPDDGDEPAVGTAISTQICPWSLRDSTQAHRMSGRQSTRQSAPGNQVKKQYFVEKSKPLPSIDHSRKRKGTP